MKITEGKGRGLDHLNIHHPDVYGRLKYSFNPVPTIHQIGVSPERKGYGTALVLELLEKFPNIKEWRVMAPNAKSKKLFEKLGLEHGIKFTF